MSIQNSIQPLQTTLMHFDDQKVRFVTLNSNPYMVLTDVCRVLGIKNNRHASKRLNATEKRGVAFCDTAGRPNTATVINEKGLYRLLMRCNKDNPKIVKFQDWVFGEVLPGLRKKVQNTLTDEQISESPMAVLQDFGFKSNISTEKVGNDHNQDSSSVVLEAMAESITLHKKLCTLHEHRIIGLEEEITSLEVQLKEARSKTRTRKLSELQISVIEILICSGLKFVDIARVMHLSSDSVSKVNKAAQ